MKLHNPSDEQLNIINMLNDNNVLVDAVAGSGKTTTNLHLAKTFNNKNILLLTYNSKLKIETRNKVAYFKISNLETHSYHSFAVKYYDHKCFTDKILMQCVHKNTKPLKQFNYDLIVLDEAQDITPLYFQFIHKIYNDNNLDAKICILGDKNQSIYDFNKADERFIVYADELFNFNNLFWKKCQLSESFRITNEMAKFINKCMLNHNRILSNKISGKKPNYIICDTFGPKYGLRKELRTFDIVKDYLKSGYKPEDIFILAPSVKSVKSPVRILENKIKLELKNIPLYVPISDEEKLDFSILKNKLVFSTYHQAKGLERKVIILFNFDNSYFNYYKKDKNPRICPNEMYVAATRGIDHITFIHHYQNDFLPFLNKQNLELYANVECHTRLSILKSELNRNIDTSVTDLVKHLPQEVLDECLTFLNIKNIRPIDTLIDVPTKTQQDKGFESVSEITGTAIPIYYEYKLKNKISVLDILPNNENKTQFHNNPENIIIEEDIFIDSESENDESEDETYNLDDISLDNIKPDQLLYIANRWCTFKNGFLFKLKQIKDYDWLNETALNECMKRLESLNISKEAIFEKEIKIQNTNETLNRRIIGFYDCFDNNKLYEFKCVQKLEAEHYIQLAIYAYILEFLKKDNNDLNLEQNSNINYFINNEEKSGIITQIYKNGNVNIRNNETHKIDKVSKNDISIKRKYYLYNIFTDELNEISFETEKLKQMVKYLIYSKYINNKEVSDDKFKSNIYEIIKKNENISNI